MRVADQFRLWCTFEASVVAYRRLPVFIAGRGIATSQVAMKHLGIFFFAFPGIKPPPEVRTLAYMNVFFLVFSVAAPIFAPFLFVVIVSGTWGIILPAYRDESAYARNGQMVLRAMEDGVKRAKLGVSAGASVPQRRSSTDGSSIRSAILERSASKIQAHYRGKRDRAIVEVQRVKAEVSERFSARLSRGDSSTPSRSSTAAPDDSSPRIQPVSPPPSPPSPTAATEVSPKARRGPQRSLTSVWTHKEVTLVASLQRMLPWLPAYDRRDALVVRALLGMVASELSQSEQGDTEGLCALAASCFSAAKLTPSPGDPVGKLDVQSWLAQKAIHLPMTRPLPLPALAKFGWRTFRGSPDQLVTPGGRLRVMGSSSTPTPTPSSEWDAGQVEVVREGAIAWQVMWAANFGIGAVFYISIYIGLALDFTIAEGADQAGLTYTIWPIATVGWLYTCTLWLALVYAHIRYPMANYPHPTHGPSFAMILGGDGYAALNDYAAYVAFHVACYVILVIPLLVMDTAAFTRSSALLRTAYSADLVRERHPASPVAAQVAYIAMLAGTQTWAIHMAMDTSYATWHMWHCGRRAGRGYFTRSPDSKSITVVRFAEGLSRFAAPSDAHHA